MEGKFVSLQPDSKFLFMIKPFRPLLLLFYVGVLLAIALYFLPSEYTLPNGVALRSFTFESMFETAGKKYADISAVTEKFTPLTGNPEKTQQQAVSKQTKQPFADTLESRYRIQFPAGNDTVLALFFRSVAQLKTQQNLVRALHYGDSQIEGDRITSFLRNKLQQKFGGCGVGLVPLLDPLGNRTSIIIESDNAWKKRAAYGADHSKKVAKNYGVMGSYFNFSFTYSKQIKPDSAASDSLQAKPKFVSKQLKQVAVEYQKPPLAYQRDKRFENIKLLYKTPEAPVTLKIESSKDSLKSFVLAQTSEPSVFQQPFYGTFKKLKLSFEGTKSPEFYGVALDCNTGIAVDNMPFRGSSGTEFTRMNREILKAQFAQLNVKLIILQFGVNVVPYVRKDYKFYERQCLAQLKLLRELAPEASILVVGVSDMSRKEGENYVTFPNVELIRDAQKRAAFAAGCAFWDLYTAMGGKDSMPSWVFAKPALANKDFTHFTPKGAQIVAEMLFKSIEAEYEKFSHR